jgi:hypothetical protein
MVNFYLNELNEIHRRDAAGCFKAAAGSPEFI